MTHGGRVGGSAEGLSRRDLLGFVLALPFLPARLKGEGQARRGHRLDLVTLSSSPGTVVPAEDGVDVSRVELIREWTGSMCRPRLVNRGDRAVRVREVVLIDLESKLPAATQLYGEGFQMLSQTGGTVGAPVDYASYTDARHYRIPVPEGTRAFYGALALTPPRDDVRLLAFTSCRRFSGLFRLRGPSLQVVVDTEGLEIAPGDTWSLEELTFSVGRSRQDLLADVAGRLSIHHPPATNRAEGAPRVPTPPTGWCSWSCFGPRVTAQQVLDNLDAIARVIPGLTYVQIDDGYQSAMGDWLETGSAFGGNVQQVLEQIRARGFQPAIWVAPFVAEEGSHVFQQHRDWFVKDNSGEPLRSDRVTFGGWRRGPWYALDGTHPGVQQHFEHLFRTMRRDWGCTYFKLDANFWGAIHGGRFRDPRATRVEAYRRGMEAILRGAGDAFILGCNHPIWPSVGLIHGSRSSNDIKRTWERISSTARQNLSRNWQNGRLWWNDPDAAVLSRDLSDEECRFHATVVFATGGMVLSGDDLTVLPEPRLAMLRRLTPPTGIAAVFDDDTFRIGVVRLPQGRMVCLLNWGDVSQTLTVRLPRPALITEVWTGQSLERREAAVTIRDMPPRSGRLLWCDEAGKARGLSRR